MSNLCRPSKEVLDELGQLMKERGFNSVDNGGAVATTVVSYRSKFAGVSMEHCPDGYLLVAITGLVEAGGFQRKAKYDTTLMLQEMLEPMYGNCAIHPLKDLANIIAFGKIDSAELFSTMPGLLKFLPGRTFA